MSAIGRNWVVSASALAFISVAGVVAAQSQSATAPGAAVSTAPPAASQQYDPLKRPLSDHEKVQQQKELKHELKGEYKKWLDEDVVWIISDQEIKAFKSLSNDEERDNFIEQFWLRRNPNQDSPDNEFKEEHYRRIAYANEHFAAGKPGWKTDRGRLYIMYGKPDDIDQHPSGGDYNRPMEEGGGQTSTYPFEIWHYRYLEGIGDNIDVEFVDTCLCGDYHMTYDRSEKDALLHNPGMAPTLFEQMGVAKIEDRFKSGVESLGTGPLSAQQNSKEFDRIDMYARLTAPPVIKFKDLESVMVDATLLKGPIFPFEVRTDYVKVTNDTVLVPITLQMRNRDITFTTKDGVSKGTVNILIRATTLTGRIAQTYEDTVQIEEPAELLSKTQDNNSVYWKALPLRPGRYRLDVAIKDVNNAEHIGRWARGIEVPKYDDDQLSASSLILADKMERVPSKEIGSGNFVIGNTFIRPRVSSSPTIPVRFKRTQYLSFWMQVYNLGIDDKSKQNSANIQYELVNLDTNKTILDVPDSSNKINPNADQITLEKTLPLASLTPGNYKVTVRVDDSVKAGQTGIKQQIAESAAFVVE